MDPISHAALGASFAASYAPAHQRRLAALIGGAAALLPDADSLIRSEADPLLVLDFHRHFTHSLLFIPLGAALAALLLWPFLRKRLSAARVYGFSLAGISTAALLDACTSYGTQLWLPFSTDKVAWNLVSVVDPLFTLLLLIPLVLGLRQPVRAWVRVGVVLAALYLTVGYVQQQRVTTNLREVIAARGHDAQHVTVKPTLGNLLLWRSIYRHGSSAYVDATHAGFTLRHYAGESMPLLLTDEPPHAHDIARFRHFSDGWLVQPRAGFIGDARYAMLPTAIAPIWGIRWDATGQLEFISEHTMSVDDRARWLRMLKGQALK
jgi:inner membrane protein